MWYVCDVEGFCRGAWRVSAARPARYPTIAADLPGQACPQEEPLRRVLLGLGLEDEKLADLHAVDGVMWRLGRNFHS